LSKPLPNSLQKALFNFFQMQQSNYTPPSTDCWTGRKTDPSLGKEYWYQCIEMLDMRQPLTLGCLPDVTLLGYACEEGVRRNQGRIGTAGAPARARHYLGRLANHLGQIRIADAGDVFCPTGDLESTHKTLSFTVAELLRAGIRPIVIGGGHDIAYGHFNGIRSAVKGTIGIINFDAHFDLREPVDGANSGTPFLQILKENEGVGYLAVGIQRSANPPSLFTTAESYRVDYILNLHCCINSDFRKAVIERMIAFSEKFDHLYVTVDMDGFSSAVAPGVSAPSPMGYLPPFFFPALTAVLATGKVASIDIAEFNPAFDQDDITGKLVANIVETIVSSRGQLSA